MCLLLRWCLAALVCVSLLPVPGVAAGEPPLRFGLMPYAPAERLLMRFGPLERYLEAALGREVVLVSARDYASFAQQMLDDGYDFAFSAPHLALLAVRSRGWVPLVRPNLRVQPAVIVREDGPVKDLGDLRGHRLALPDRLALVTLLAEAELMHAGLSPGTEITLMHTGTHVSAVELVRRQLADACITVPALLESLPPALREGLVVRHRFPEVFSLVYVASDHLPAAEHERLRRALIAFGEAPEGAGLYPGHQTYRHEPLDAAALDAYAPLLPMLQARLGLKGAH